MYQHSPRQRHGAHRTRRDVTGPLIASLLAVAAVAALITALYVWRGEDDEVVGAAARSDTSTISPPADSPAPTPPSSSSAPASSPAAARPVHADIPEVVVLNQTERAGLAGAVAARLREQGFDVVGTGSFRGTVPATTVYFPEAADREALVVAKALPGEPRTRPRFGNLSSELLTVVVTDSYPS